MKNFLGKMFRDARRQTVSPAQPARLSGINTAAAPGTALEPITRRGTDGRGRTLFIPDVDPLDDDSFYFGDDPIEPKS